MSVMSNLMIEIEELISNSDMSLEEISTQVGLPLEDVVYVYNHMSEYDSDDMDGDAQTALASAGWGTDEDYVIDNDYFDDY